MNKFAFIIHPMDVKRDAARKFPILKVAPLSFVESLMTKIKPQVMGEVTGITSKTGAQCEGWLLGCPLGPRQLLGQTGLDVEIVYDKIAAAGRLGAELGAKIVGLGAYTSVAGDAGVSVARRLDGIISVTSGNSYTVYTAVEGLLKAAELMEVDIANARVAIIGATGAIGAVCAKMLSPQVGAISLIGRNVERLEKLRDELNALPKGAPADVATDIPSALKEADLVLAVSAAGKELVFPNDLKVGAIVCDVARPRDVSKSVVEQRDDVLVIEGGVIEVPGANVDFGFNFGFPPRTAYACMSETILMALEGTYEPYTLGRDLTVEQVERIGALANKHGFGLSGFRAFEKSVTPEVIRDVKNRAMRKKVVGAGV